MKTSDNRRTTMFKRLFKRAKSECQRCKVYYDYIKKWSEDKLT